MWINLYGCVGANHRKFLNLSNFVLLIFHIKNFLRLRRVDYMYAIHGQKEVVHKQQSLSFHPRQSFDRCMITHVNFCVFLLTCMFRELLQEFIPIPIFGDVANEKTMVIE